MSVKSAKKKPTMADQADIHELYELSVQNVEHEIEFLQQTFKSLSGRTAHLLREDFCGTASASCEWVRQGKEFQAIGVDIDPSVLEWGRENRVGRLAPEDRARVRLFRKIREGVAQPGNHGGTAQAEKSVDFFFHGQRGNQGLSLIHI